MLFFLVIIQRGCDMFRTSETLLFLFWPSFYVSRRTSEMLVLNQSISYFDFIVTALTPLTKYYFYLHFLRKLEKAPNWTLKKEEYVPARSVSIVLSLPSSTLLTSVYSEDSNMSYLLHYVESGSDSGSNAANEPVINVDYVHPKDGFYSDLNYQYHGGRFHSPF